MGTIFMRRLEPILCYFTLAVNGSDCVQLFRLLIFDRSLTFPVASRPLKLPLMRSASDAVLPKRSVDEPGTFPTDLERLEVKQWRGETRGAVAGLLEPHDELLHCGALRGDPEADRIAGADETGIVPALNRPARRYGQNRSNGPKRLQPR